MAKVLPLVVTTVLFLSYFIWIFSTVELKDVRANWNVRRCEPLVMLIAQQVPTDPGIDTSAFASENFDFCIGKIIDSVLASAFSPVKQVFDKQVDTAGFAQRLLNTLRQSAVELMRPILNLVQILFDKMKFMMYQAIRVFFKLQSSIDRIYAILTGTLFAGIAMFRGFQNYIDFVVKVCLIILAILVVLVIFLFFVMAPFVPTILATIAVLVATAAGASAGGMRSAFCVAPDTQVKLQEGWKAVSAVQAGDVLYGGAVVEGVLQTMRKDEACVEIHGLIISASHLLLHNGKWIFASDHPEAKQPANASKLPKRLFCLNTSDRCWTVKTKQGEEVLRDWEELPEEEGSEDSMCSWEALIYELLNRQAIVSTGAWAAPGRGLFGGDTLVHCCGRGHIPIREVQVGDWITDHNHSSDTDITFTQVIGVYRDTSELVPMNGPNASVWCWLEGKSVWRHPMGALGNTSVKEGYQLVTDSGTFKTVDGLWVRDFTEVGHTRIHETYAHTAERLATEEK